MKLTTHKWGTTRQDGVTRHLLLVGSPHEPQALLEHTWDGKESALTPLEITEEMQEMLHLGERYLGPDDPRLPDDVQKMPVGRREDFVDEFNFQLVFYSKRRDESYDENKPIAVNAVRFALDKARKRIEKKDDGEAGDGFDERRSDTPAGAQALEYIEENGARYYRLKEEGIGLFTPGDMVETHTGGFSHSITIIEKGWSLNNRYYTDAAIDDIAELAAKRVVSFLNHGDTFGRDPQDWAGMITGASREGVRARGRLHVFEEPDGRWLKERIEKAHELFGVSIDAFARVEEGEAEGRKGLIVKEIVRLNSVDIVMFPGAKGAFDGPGGKDRQRNAEEGKSLMDVKTLKEQHPDTYRLLVAEVEAHWQGKVTEAESKAEAAEEKAQALEAEKAKLEARVDEFESQQAEAQYKVDVNRLIETDLPESARSEAFTKTCHSLYQRMDKKTDKALEVVREMIADRKQSFESGRVVGNGEMPDKKEEKKSAQETGDLIESAKAVWKKAKASGE